MPFEKVNIDTFLYPTPRERVAEPKPAAFNVGDFVRSKIGETKGKVGIVVTERNANYVDYEPYAGNESIGVGFAEHENLAEELKEIIAKVTKNRDDIISVVRWFDSPKQLQLVAAANQD